MLHGPSAIAELLVFRHAMNAQKKLPQKRKMYFQQKRKCKVNKSVTCNSESVRRHRSVFFSCQSCWWLLCRAFKYRTLYGRYLPTVILIIISFLSPTHSFIPGLKSSFSANPFHRSLWAYFSSSGLTTWIPRGLFTDTSVFYFFCFSHFHFFSCRFRVVD